MPKSDRRFYAEYILFYRKWGIQSFASWELPIILQPELYSPTLVHLSSVSEAGLLMFVPWYLTRDKGIQLADIADLRRERDSPEHLGEWLDKRPKNWGYERYTVMFYLYVYLICGLNRRYPKKTRGHLQALDDAFGTYFARPTQITAGLSTNAETIRKIRLEMNRRLRKSHEES